MQRDELLYLLDYMDWARARTLECIARATPEAWRSDLGGSFGTLHRTLAHIYGAEMIWSERLTGTESPAFPDAASVEDPAELERRWKQTAARLRHWAELLPPGPVEQTIQYRDTKGNRHTSSVTDVILQLSHHQSYHRGQVTHMLRQLGLQPLPTDYIAFCRLHPAPR
jgi:uncharacterized damage-inducible protein DinB